MKGHLVGGLRIDALDYVDFSTCWPGFVGPQHPHGRPRATDSSGHVSNVCNDESVLEGLG